MSKIYVIGGGAAGMLAAIFAARNGHKVVLFEKYDRLGKKLFITGKGRCNITNACDRDEFFEQIISNPKFFFRAYHSFSNFDTMDFFEQLGLPLKTERGNRVFPLSDKSSDVIAVLRRELERQGVEIKYQTEVSEVVTREGSFYGIKLKGKKEVITADAIIITTGGLSYPLTGSTGDGFEFAKSLGHKVTQLSPSLVPIHVKESFV